MRLFKNSHAALALSLVSVAAVACGGAPSAPIDDGAPEAVEAPADTPSASPDPGPAATPTRDASAPSVEPATPPIAKHCNVEAATPDVCVENAQGRPGETVDVEIHLVGNAACGDAWEAAGRIAFDPTKLTLENAGEHVACRTRMVGPAIQGGGEDIVWQAFGGGSLSGCDANVPLGKVDTLRLKIAPGTAPGDYPLAWRDAGFIGNANAAPACTNIGKGISGTLRVLP